MVGGRGRWAMEGMGHERGWGMDGGMVGDLGRGVMRWDMDIGIL